MTGDQTLGECLISVAEARRRQAPMRVFVALLFAASFLWRLDTPWLWAWLVGYVAAQGFEVWALWPFRRDGSRAGRLRNVVALASISVLALAWGSLAVFIWRVGGSVGPAASVLLLCTGVLNVLGNTRGCAPAFAAGAAPYLLLTLALPLSWAGEAEQAFKPTFLAASLLFAAAVLLIWRDGGRTGRREREALAALEAQRAAAVAADESRRRFVAVVSHELRTPLSAIMAASATIEARAVDDTKRRSAALIADSSRLMRRLLDDLLDLAKLEAGGMTVEAVAFDLRELVAGSARLWAEPAAAKGVILELEGVETLPERLVGDPLRLGQVLNNLLSNAVKFTAEGEVRLRCASAPAPGGRVHLTLDVLDTGRGLEAHELADLFTPFAQAEHSDARLHGGTGLGLPISRELARLMGGDLQAAAREDRTGARLTLTLTLPEPLPESAAPPAPRAGRETAPGLRVLVVDDHPVSRRALRLVLEAADALVTEAPGGSAALAQLAVEPFDLVLTDLHMPLVDGREMTRRLRGHDGPNRGAPVIGVSGDGDDPAARADAGLDGWVMKPVEPAALFAAIDAALSARPELRAAG